MVSHSTTLRGQFIPVPLSDCTSARTFRFRVAVPPSCRALPNVRSDHWQSRARQRYTSCLQIEFNAVRVPANNACIFLTFEKVPCVVPSFGIYFNEKDSRSSYWEFSVQLVQRCTEFRNFLTELVPARGPSTLRRGVTLMSIIIPRHATVPSCVAVSNARATAPAHLVFVAPYAER